MASGNIFKLLAEIKALKLDYAGAVRYLTDKGVEVTGIIKQGLNNFFKKNKARDVDFGSVVKKIPYDDFNVPFNPNNPLKNYSKGKDGVGTLFKNKSKTLADELAQAEGVETFETILPTKKLPDIKMGSRINYEAIADKAGIDVELIRGKNWEEIMEIIKGKADGGRVGFEIGGLSGEAQSIYDAWISAGHSEADTLDYLTSRGMYNAGEGEKGITSILNTQPGIINQGGGDDNYFGPGATTKEFNVQQWGAIDGPPGSMGWKDVSITGYETPGGWKTKQGKNIIHAGLLTGDPEEGDIKGTPLDWRGIPSNLWGLGAKAITKLKDWTSGQQNNQNEIIEEEQKKKAAALILASQAAESGDIITRGPIGGQPGINEGLDFSSGPTVEEQVSVEDLTFSKGGLATMFARRR